MKTAAINQEISAWYSVLTPEQKESVLRLIKSFIKNDKPISRKQYNKELTAAEKRINSGKYFSHDSLEKLSEKW